ncbi:MAG: class I SAM-dependent methyltransferase [Deltaproteobacteria bacterium]|nr:class I SAM-dependent methyltransferase [Deltaproteobacteria bacterium]
MNLTDRNYWQAFWGSGAKGPAYLLTKGDCEFHEIFSASLPPATEARPVDFLEIGCYPGRFLYYFAREFGYRVSGLDFLPETAELSDRLAEKGVQARVYVGDFFHFEPEQRYDVVFSYGFVEHFTAWQEVLDRQLALLKPGGTLVIELPNFRYGQYWLRKLLDPSFAEGHVLEVMDPHLWGRALTRRGLELQYCDYFETFQIWIGPAARAAKGKGFMKKCWRGLFACFYLIQKIIQRLKINIPNRYFSPYILVVARMPH